MHEGDKSILYTIPLNISKKANSCEELQLESRVLTLKDQAFEKSVEHDSKKIKVNSGRNIYTRLFTFRVRIFAVSTTTSVFLPIVVSPSTLIDSGDNF